MAKPPRKTKAGRDRKRCREAMRKLRERRKEIGITQVAVFLPADALAVLDAQAAALGFDRSGALTAILRGEAVIPKPSRKKIKTPGKAPYPTENMDLFD